MKQRKTTADGKKDKNFIVNDTADGMNDESDFIIVSSKFSILEVIKEEKFDNTSNEEKKDNISLALSEILPNNSDIESSEKLLDREVSSVKSP